MAEIIENEKLPWPNRLVLFSFTLFKIAWCVCLTGIISAIAEEASNLPFFQYLAIPAFGIWFVLLACSFVLAAGSLMAMPFYRCAIGAGHAIGIIAILLFFSAIGYAIIMPGLIQARQLAQRINCAKNLRLAVEAALAYQQEHQKLPAEDNWCDSLKPYIKKDTVFECTTDDIGPCSYAMNAGIPDDTSDLPPDMVLLFESAPGWNRTGGPTDVVTDRHGKHRPGANIAFADGRVEFIPADNIPALRWTVEKGTKRAVEKNFAGVQRE